MLTMRLMRFGAKKKPHYRIVVIESSKQTRSRALDTVGYYSPTEEPEKFKIDQAKAKQWLSRGVRPSRTVQALLNKVSSPAIPTQATKT